MKSPQNRPLKIGITGGIGSGKTTVCRIFEVLGIPVYYADDRAKRIMVENREVIDGVIGLFGEQAYLENGGLNRSYIADIAFADPARLQALNKIVHPAVFADAERWFLSHPDSPYALKEAALLVESGSYKHLDKLIVVTAPEATRIERVMKRDQVSGSSVRERMKNQLPEEEKIALADFIIYNQDGRSLLKQVWRIHNKILLMCKEL